MHFRVKGKRAKIRFVPVNAAAQRTIEDYLARAGHRKTLRAPPPKAHVLISDLENGCGRVGLTRLQHR
jgi:site-specific recombinase XerD